MDNLRLRPMTKEEFEIYFAEMRDRIMRDGMRAFSVSEEVSKRIVEKDFSDIIGHGFETKNNYWFTLVTDETNVGSLWYSIKGEGEKATPYLTDMVIAPHFRNKGFGQKTLTLLETELKSRGIKNNIAVHILGDFNKAAIRLFQSSGYFVSSILMEKTIST